MIAGQRIFATEFRQRLDKLCLIAACFQHQELAIRLSLLFEVAVDGDLPVAKYQNLVAALFDVEQQVRRQDDVRLAAVANLSNQLDHSQSRRRIETIGWFVEKDQLWTMNDRLREFRKLLHAQRIRFEPAITRFAESNIEQRFVRTFQCSFGRQPGQFGHQANEMHCAHLCDERIALGHVADQRLDLLCLVDDVVAEDLRSAGGRRMKPKQRVDERCLAGAVWTEQTDCFAAQIAAQIFQYRPATKSTLRPCRSITAGSCKPFEL